jgi:hypothetical protein
MSSGTSSIGKWDFAFNFPTVNQGWAAANISCAWRNSGPQGLKKREYLANLDGDSERWRMADMIFKPFAFHGLKNATPMADDQSSGVS